MLFETQLSHASGHDPLSLCGMATRVSFISVQQCNGVHVHVLYMYS